MPFLIGLTLIIIVLIQFSKSRDKNVQKRTQEFWKRERESNFIPKRDISALNYITIPFGSLPFRYQTPGTEQELPVSQNTAPVYEVADFSYEPGSFSVITTKSDAHRVVDELLEEIASEDSSLQRHTPAPVPVHTAPLAEELAAVEAELCKLAGSRIINLTGISNTELRLTYGTANLDPLTAYDHNFTVLIRTLQKWGTLLASAEQKEDAITVLAYAVSIGSDIAGTYALLARLYKERDELDRVEALKESAEALSTLMKPSILRDLEQITAGKL